MMEKDQFLKEILEIVSQARNKILLYGESSLSESQFHAFRKLVFDEFGRNGIEGKLKLLFSDKVAEGKFRAGVRSNLVQGGVKKWFDAP